MKKQIHLLYTIQSIDTKVQSSKDLQKKYQGDMTRLEDEMKEDEGLLAAAKEKFESFEKSHRDHERELKSLDEQKKKIEEKMLSVKTNKEYQASMQEIESIKESMSKKEDDIIIAMDNIEAARVDVQKAEEALKKAQQLCAEKKKQIEGELQVFLEDIEKQKLQREDLLKEVKPDILSDYLRIQKARHGLAVAQTEDEMCLGCSMHIPPQTYNEAVLGEKLITCPHCHRILYAEPADEKSEEAAGQG